MVIYKMKSTDSRSSSNKPGMHSNRKRGFSTYRREPIRLWMNNIKHSRLAPTIRKKESEFYRLAPTIRKKQSEF